jgi:hypothetical protein
VDLPFCANDASGLLYGCHSSPVPLYLLAQSKAKLHRK